MRDLRDVYLATTGPSEWMLAELFGVDSKSLHQHAWRHGWPRRRSWDRAAMERSFLMTVWARLRKASHLVSPDSADKMLKLLGKSIGIGQQVKVEVEGKMTWEKLLAQALDETGKNDRAEEDS